MKKCITAILCIASSFAFAQDIEWASKVVAYSTQYSATQYSAQQVLGKPNCMPQGGDNPCAWAPSKKSSNEFIEVGFDKPMKIQQVIISENYNAGMIKKVDRK